MSKCEKEPVNGESGVISPEKYGDLTEVRHKIELLKEAGWRDFFTVATAVPADNLLYAGSKLISPNGSVSYETKIAIFWSQLEDTLPPHI